MIKAVVTGAAGRMGSRIIHLLSGSSRIKLHGAVEQPDHPLIGKDAGGPSGSGTTGILISASLDQALEGGDVLIDFTAPPSSLEHLRIAARRQKAAVIGTTGFTDKERAEIGKMAAQIPCVLSPNMSVGVNVLFKVLADITRVTGRDYDVEVTEIHHRHKKDAPSGTAMRMAQVIAEALREDLSASAVYSRHGMSGERRTGQIGIQSLRGGDVVGDHTVTFAGPGERLEITHRAQSRDNFARGALIAAEWIASKNSGLYDMQDVLGLR